MTIMIVLFLSFFLVVTANAQLPYDSNCFGFAAKKGWIKSGSSNSASRTYDKDKIKKDFHISQAKLKKQITAWEKLDAEIPCFEKTTGVTFQKSPNGQKRLVINDHKSFQNFRLSGGIINCNLNVKQVEYKSLENRPKILNDTKASPQTVQNYDPIANNYVFDAIYPNKGANSKFPNMARTIHQDLLNALKDLKSLGDLGWENYCSHQLYSGASVDELRTTKSQFDKCKANHKAKGCQDYPHGFVKKYDQVGKELKQIQADMAKPTSQPVMVLNKTDTRLYTPYKNNLAKLNLAKSQAKEAVVQLANDYEDFRKNFELVKSENLANCGEENEMWTRQYLKGEQCLNTEAPINSLRPQIVESAEAIKKLHQEKFIHEMNVSTFGETMKAKYLRSSPAVQAQMRKDPHKSCLQILKDVGAGKAAGFTCSGDYLKSMRKHLSDVESDPSSFLALPPEEVVSEVQGVMKRMQELCIEIRKQYFPAFGSPLIHHEPYKYGYEKMKAELKEEKAKLGNMKSAGFLYSNAFNKSLPLNTFTPENGCTNNRLDQVSFINTETVSKAVKEFEDAIDDQLYRSAKYSLPNRGEIDLPISMAGGALDAAKDYISCGETDAGEKEVMAALFRSQPYRAGKLVSSLAPEEKGVYNAMLCDALKCKSNQDDVTDWAINGAKIAAVLGGPQAEAAVAAGEFLVNYGRSKEAYELAMGGVVAGGISGYESDIHEFIEKMKEEGDEKRLALNISEEALKAYTKVLGMDKPGAIQSLGKGLENALLKIAPNANPAQIALMHSLAEKMVETSISKGFKGVKGELTRKDFLPSDKDIVAAAMGVLKTSKNTKYPVIDVFEFGAQEMIKEKKESDVISDEDAKDLMIDTLKDQLETAVKR